MADWFKLYENDLDDERLQWAMSEQQQTAIIYVTILSRCCREKSGTLSWAGQDFELFALAQRAHVSAPVANQSLGLLQKIEFIKIENGELKVLRWNDRQSEYCQKKRAAVPTVSRHSPDNIPRVSPERRGEERRLEESINNKCPPASQPPKTNGVVDFEKFWNAYPRKVAKFDAEHAWAEVSASKHLSAILTAIQVQSGSEGWTRENGKFIPYPAAWLRDGRWNDSPASYKPQSCF